MKIPQPTGAQGLRRIMVAESEIPDPLNGIVVGQGSLGNGSYKKVCGFCTFVHTMWKGTKLHRGFTSDVHSYKKKFVPFYHLVIKQRSIDLRLFNEF